MGRNTVPRWFTSRLSGLRDGDWASVLFLAKTLGVSYFALKLHSRAVVGSAKVCWVVDIHHDHCLYPGILSTLDSQLRLVNNWLEDGRQTHLSSFWQSCKDATGKFPSRLPAIPSNIFSVSTVILVATLAYYYLMGNVDKGGSKAYSRSSLDFRDIYVAIVLFLGTYVWIKFRKVAFRGVHRREIPGKQGRKKVVYEARLKPPMCNRQKVPRLDLGQFSSRQEAHTKFLIAAFYYNRDAGLLDGWFQVPPMSEEEQKLAGKEKRKWVIGQAKKVYEDFKKGEKVEAALVQELPDACEGQVTQESAEVNVDPCGASLLNSVGHQQPVLVSQAENSTMGVDMIGANHGLEYASYSFDGMHEGLALPDGHSVGSEEGSALPVSQLPLNIECLDGSDHLDLLQTVRTQPQQIFLQQNQISDPQEQISLLQQQISLLKQQLQESRIQNPQWPCQFCLQQQQLQDVSQGFPSFEVEMEQSMHQLNYPGLMSPPPDGGEDQETSWEMDTLW